MSTQFKFEIVDKIMKINVLNENNWEIESNHYAKIVNPKYISYVQKNKIVSHEKDAF